MKRNQLASLYMILLCLVTIISLYIPQVEAESETVIIPNEAIRLRILANSDNGQDQQVKRAIRDEVNANITEWVADLTSLEEARRVIRSHLGDIQAIAESYVKEQGLQQTVKVEFGKAEFPTKLYGQFLYPAGEYEAIVITLGEGKGANWWCVLFPPLCFLDFSSGTAVSMTPMEEEQPEVEEEMVETQEPVVETVMVEDELTEPLAEEQTRMEDEVKEQIVAAPIYVEQDEKVDVIEKRVLVIEVIRGLFAKE
ncbi:MAG: stage II sporulation protein R [Bacillus sp. (in: firmicutes)]